MYAILYINLFVDLIRLKYRPYSPPAYSSKYVPTGGGCSMFMTSVVSSVVSLL